MTQELCDPVVGGPVDPAVFLAGEVIRGEVEAFGWRFQAVEVAYEARRVLAVGGPVMFAVTAGASLVGNHRARAAARRWAAPQWRPLGPLRIWVTDERLVVLRQGAWASVWYQAICQVHPVGWDRLDLAFDDDPPYALAGPGVGPLTGVLLTVLAERARHVAMVPGLH